MLKPLPELGAQQPKRPSEHPVRSRSGPMLSALDADHVRAALDAMLFVAVYLMTAIREGTFEWAPSLPLLTAMAVALPAGGTGQASATVQE